VFCMLAVVELQRCGCVAGIAAAAGGAAASGIWSYCGGTLLHGHQLYVEFILPILCCARFICKPIVHNATSIFYYT
jgi:hypothetical protein